MPSISISITTTVSRCRASGYAFQADKPSIHMSTHVVETNYRAGSVIVISTLGSRLTTARGCIGQIDAPTTSLYLAASLESLLAPHCASIHPQGCSPALFTFSAQALCFHKQNAGHSDADPFPEGQQRPCGRCAPHTGDTLWPAPCCTHVGQASWASKPNLRQMRMSCAQYGGIRPCNRSHVRNFA